MLGAKRFLWSAKAKWRVANRFRPGCGFEGGEFLASHVGGRQQGRDVQPLVQAGCAFVLFRHPGSPPRRVAARSGNRRHRATWGSRTGAVPRGFRGRRKPRDTGNRASDGVYIDLGVAPPAWRRDRRTIGRQSPVGFLVGRLRRLDAILDRALQISPRSGASAAKTLDPHTRSLISTHRHRHGRASRHSGEGRPGHPRL
jgi:hypothetical protein